MLASNRPVYTSKHSIATTRDTIIATFCNRAHLGCRNERSRGVEVGWQWLEAIDWFETSNGSLQALVTVENTHLQKQQDILAPLLAVRLFGQPHSFRSAMTHEQQDLAVPSRTIPPSIIYTAHFLLWALCTSQAARQDLTSTDLPQPQPLLRGWGAAAAGDHRWSRHLQQAYTALYPGDRCMACLTRESLAVQMTCQECTKA